MTYKWWDKKNVLNYSVVNTFKCTVHVLTVGWLIISSVMLRRNFSALIADLLGIIEPIIWSSCKASSEILNLSLTAITCWITARSWDFLTPSFSKLAFSSGDTLRGKKDKTCPFSKLNWTLMEETSLWTMLEASWKALWYFLFLSPLWECFRSKNPFTLRGLLLFSVPQWSYCNKTYEIIKTL